MSSYLIQTVEISDLPQWAQEKLKTDFQIDRTPNPHRYGSIAAVTATLIERATFPSVIEYAKEFLADAVRWYRDKYVSRRVDLSYDNYRFFQTGFDFICSFDHEPAVLERAKSPLINDLFVDEADALAGKPPHSEQYVGVNTGEEVEL